MSAEESHSRTHGSKKGRGRGRGVKARFSRTKTGCFTCRARRKKCDEERDEVLGACRRCRKANVECLGFPPLRSAPSSALIKAAEDWTAHASSITATASFRQRDDSERQAEVSEKVGEGSKPVDTADVLPFDMENGGDQLLYENILFDSMVFSQPAQGDETAPCGGNPPRSPAFSLHERSSSASLSLSRADTTKEDRVLDSLVHFYASFCWHRWQPLRRSYTKADLVADFKSRLQSSDLLCISVACVALCYGMSSPVTLPHDTPRFLADWPEIYALVITAKSDKLCAFLDWLGETSQDAVLGQKHLQAAESIREGKRSAATTAATAATAASASQQQGGESIGITTTQGDILFHIAAQTLQQVASAANHDQELPLDRATHLDTTALAHVDKFLHSAMDLALFAYASQSSHAFLLQMEAAKDLVHSLLGRSQSVHLCDLRSIEMTGLRSFVWADITNAVLSGRSTILHYIAEEERQGRHSQRSRDSNHEGEQDGLSFGCPDDILVVFASIANLHFQLLHARKAGVLSPSGGLESLPAWALHQAHDLAQRIEQSQERADSVATASSRGSRHSERYALGTIWRHGAHIFLSTAVHRKGPLAGCNQSALHAALQWYNSGSLQPTNIAMGNAALPLLLASFVAITPSDKQMCMKALREIGTGERGRDSYRQYVEKVWKCSDEAGFGVLWQDILVKGHESIAIM